MRRLQKEIPALAVRDLVIEANNAPGTFRVIDDVSLTVQPGERLGIVGESGSGKSLTMRAALGLLPKAVQQRAGTVSYFGEELTKQRNIQRYCSVVFQEALSALNPTRRIGDIVADGVQISQRVSRKVAKQRAIALLEDVGIPDPERRYTAYTHELSGGLRQRVMIAAALSTEPRVLICDEPTTALDVTIQKQVCDLLLRLTRQRGMTLVFVSHDLGLVEDLCDHVAVMYAGRVVETGAIRDVLRSPRHPYTQALLEATLPVTHKGQFRATPTVEERERWASAPMEVHA